MIVKTYGSAISGVHAISITIEVNAADWGARFYLVGLPDNAVKESERRIESAIMSIGFRMPRMRTVVNMAPADIRKAGAAYDLPIALCILASSGQLPADTLPEYTIMGELSLDGSVLPVKGALPMAIQALQDGFKGMIVPRQNAREAAMVKGLPVYGVAHITEAMQLFTQPGTVAPEPSSLPETPVTDSISHDADFRDVRGQQQIKRALEIAAAGGHNVLLIGPPGAGKTMLARRMPGILPPLSLAEALETTKIHSVAGKMPAHTSLISGRPFRAPHHSISDSALVGGGNPPQPGEISLAHNGVLFLDELPEFRRHVLEVLRQPLEERKVLIARARHAVEFPAGFMLLAAMNPCPCGYYNHPQKRCSCAPGQVQKYLNRISGPLLDRIDLHVQVTPVPASVLSDAPATESSMEVRERVIAARRVQAARFADSPQVHCNAQMSSALLHMVACPDTAGKDMLQQAMEQLQLSARAYDRILRVSRTIADLEGAERVAARHLAEAIQYRSLDRKQWGD